MSIIEKDWKLIRSMKDQKLNDASLRIINKVRSVTKECSNNAHKTYLDMWSLLKKEDECISAMFDDIKRSNAIFKLAAWKKYGFLSDEELGEFSQETKEILNAITQNNR